MLKKLYLGLLNNKSIGDNNIGDEGIMAIAKNCTKLATLYLGSFRAQIRRQ